MLTVLAERVQRNGGGIMTWTDSQHCQSHAHCRACRTRPEWRERVGAPDVCPDGYTAERLPVAPRESRGLGDTVAKVIHAATLGAVKPCAGCRERQAKLNKLLPYGDRK